MKLLSILGFMILSACFLSEQGMAYGEPQCTYVLAHKRGNISEFSEAEFYKVTLRRLGVKSGFKKWQKKIDDVLRSGEGLGILDGLIEAKAEQDVIDSFAQYNEEPSDSDMYYESEAGRAYLYTEVLISLYLYHSKNHSKSKADAVFLLLKENEQDFKAFWSPLTNSNSNIPPGDVLSLVQKIDPAYEVLKSVGTRIEEIIFTYIRSYSDEKELTVEIMRLTEGAKVSGDGFRRILTTLLKAKKFHTVRRWLSVQDVKYDVGGYFYELVHMEKADFHKFLRVMKREGYAFTLSDHILYGRKTVDDEALENMNYFFSHAANFKMRRNSSGYDGSKSIAFAPVFYARTSVQRANLYRVIKARLEKDKNLKRADLLLLMKETAKRIVEGDPEALPFYVYLKNELLNGRQAAKLNEAKLYTEMRRLELVYSTDFYRNTLTLIELFDRDSYSLDLSKFNEVKKGVNGNRGVRIDLHRALKGFSNVELKALSYYLEIITSLQVEGESRVIRFHESLDDSYMNRTQAKHYRRIRPGFENNAVFFNYYTALKRILEAEPPAYAGEEISLVFRRSNVADYFAKEHTDALAQARTTSVGFDWLLEAQAVHVRAVGADVSQLVLVWSKAQTVYTQLVLQSLLTGNSGFLEDKEVYSQTAGELKEAVQILLEKSKGAEFGFLLDDLDREVFLMNLEKLKLNLEALIQ